MNLRKYFTPFILVENRYEYYAQAGYKQVIKIGFLS